jgi:hypothetical protein
MAHTLVNGMRKVFASENGITEINLNKSDINKTESQKQFLTVSGAVQKFQATKLKNNITSKPYGDILKQPPKSPASGE